MITGEAEVVPVLPGEGEHMNPWGGMEGVCRVVITMYDLLSCEFILSTEWMPQF